MVKKELKMKKTRVFRLPELKGLIALIFACYSLFCSAQVGPSVKIGSGIWATSNLASTTFQNGDSLLLVIGEEAWIEAGRRKAPAYCYYDDEQGNIKEYGLLYNWYAVNDPRGLAPIGWKIPGAEDWEAFIYLIGNGQQAVKKIKSKSGWEKKENGNNETGFNAKPSGYKSSCGHFFESAGKTAVWWTSTEEANSTSRAVTIKNESELIKVHPSNKGSGYAVRCIKVENK